MKDQGYVEQEKNAYVNDKLVYYEGDNDNRKVHNLPKTKNLFNYNKVELNPKLRLPKNKINLNIENGD